MRAESADTFLRRERFPRSNRYASNWVLQNEMGPNPLWLTELLSEKMVFEPGMRVLDLACGRALSSIFLAAEFGVEVWACDLWISPDDNWVRIRDAGVESSVVPMKAEAHDLPFAAGFFDAIVCIDAFFYFGTDDLYLSYLSRFLSPDGQLGISQPGLARELNGAIPCHLDEPVGDGDGEAFWVPGVSHSHHSVAWWRAHFERSTVFAVEHAEAVDSGWEIWLDWETARNGRGLTGYPSDAPALRADGGEWLTLLTLVARRVGARTTALFGRREWPT